MTVLWLKYLADSLLSHNFELFPHDLRLRFILWWHFGYNNGTMEERSFGLGGNIT